MGTATHDADLALVLPALGRIKQDFGDRVSFELMGVARSWDLPGWINRVPMPAMAAASYPGFVNWITGQPGWDIGLAPLTDNTFNRCKSAIKTLDYAALGMAVLASDVHAYRGSLADGPGGTLVGADDAAWYGAIALLLRNPSQRRALAVGGRQRFLETGTLAAQDAARREAWLALAPLSAPTSAPTGAPPSDLLSDRLNDPLSDPLGDPGGKPAPAPSRPRRLRASA
jgi:hypothetical protein